jgi:nucleoside 2-deoxyribosyltransferase
MLIYFAGPLFSQAERTFNLQLTDQLEALGFRVFLPQRDGAEKHTPPYDTMTQEEYRQAIFQLDTKQILACDIFLFILDGRVPDEGACVELGIAYCQKEQEQAEKLLIGFQTDMRVRLFDLTLNPMITGALDYLAFDQVTLLDVLKHYQVNKSLPAQS